MLTNSVTLYTVAYNGYWEKFGEKWTSYIVNLNPQPTEIIVVSDKPIVTDFKVVLESDLHISSFRNKAIKSASCDWVVPLDLDDEPFSCYIDKLDYNYDIIAYTLIDSNNRVYGGNEKSWNKESYDRNCVVGTSAVKRSILKTTLYRRVGWEDWMLWIDLKRKGVSIKFDSTIRFRYNRSIHGLSSTNVKEKTLEIQKEIVK